MPLKDIVDHMCHCGRPEAACIALPDPRNSGIGGDFDKDPIAPPPAGCRRRRDDHFKILQFHINVPISAPSCGGFEVVANLLKQDHIPLCGSSFCICYGLIDLRKAPMG